MPKPRFKIGNKVLVIKDREKDPNSIKVGGMTGIILDYQIYSSNVDYKVQFLHGSATFDRLILESCLILADDGTEEYPDICEWE